MCVLVHRVLCDVVINILALHVLLGNFYNVLGMQRMSILVSLSHSYFGISVLFNNVLSIFYLWL